MSLKEKGKKLLTSRNVLIILLVVCIVIVAYILIINYSGESKKILSVRNALDQSDDLIKTGEKITVKGYYSATYNYNENIIEITDSAVIPGPGSPVPGDKDKLLVDHSGVDYVIKQGNKYLFTGVLVKQDYSNLVILIASEIEESG